MDGRDHESAWRNPSRWNVSCATTTSCVAVGHGSARYDGTSWTRLVTPEPANDGGTQLNSVSCSGARCIAVGDAFFDYGASGGVEEKPRAYGERWNGSSWSLFTVPRPANSLADSLAAVSCAVTTTNCRGVGRLARAVATAMSAGWR